MAIGSNYAVKVLEHHLRSYVLTYLRTYVLTYLRTYVLTYLRTYVLTWAKYSCSIHVASPLRRHGSSTTTECMHRVVPSGSCTDLHACMHMI